MNNLTGKPTNLELLLEIVSEKNNLDPDLLAFIKENEVYPIFPSKLRHLKATARTIRIIDLKYMLEAKHPTATTEEIVNKLAKITNLIYINYNQDKPFNVALIGKEQDGLYYIFE